MSAEDPPKLNYAAAPEILSHNIRASVSLWMSIGALPLTFFSSTVGWVLVAVVNRLAKDSLTVFSIKAIALVLFGACTLWPFPYAMLTGIRAIVEIRREPAHGLWKAIAGIVLSSIFLVAGLWIVLHLFGL